MAAEKGILGALFAAGSGAQSDKRRMYVQCNPEETK
jgi:hypothetical protein